MINEQRSNDYSKDKNKPSGSVYDIKNLSKGLTIEEAESRLKKYGFNKLENKKRYLHLKYSFRNLMILLLGY